MSEIKVELTLDETQAIETLTKLDRKLKKFREDTEKPVDIPLGENNFKSFIANLKSATSSFLGFSGAMDTFKGIALFNILSAGFSKVKEIISEGVQDYLAYEKALIGVQKTTGLTGVELKNFADRVGELSKKIPVSTVELLDLSRVAGQLGVTGTDNIAKFAETVAKLNVATDIAGEEGASSLIRILSISGDSVSNIDKFASAIVDLGNNFAATESEIVHVATEVAKSTAQFELGSANVAGISTALKALGIQAQLGGSVVGKAMREIESALDKGGSKLQVLEQITGQTGEQLKKTFKDDATSVFVSFAKGLGKAADEGRSISSVMEQFGLAGDEVNKVLPVLAKRTDVLTDALTTANKAYVENIALNKEADAAYSTLGSQLAIFGNIVKDKVIDTLTPAMESARDALKEFNAELSKPDERSLNDINIRLKEINGQLSENNILFERGVSRDTAIESLNQEKKVLEELITLRNKQSAQSETGSLLIRPQAEGLDVATLTDPLIQLRDKEKEIFAEINQNTATAKEEQTEIIIEQNAVRNEQVIEQEKMLLASISELQQTSALSKEEMRLQEQLAQDQFNIETLAKLEEVESAKIKASFEAERQKVALIQDSKNKSLALKNLELKEDEALRIKHTEQVKRQHEIEKNSVSSLFEWNTQTYQNQAQNFKDSLNTIATLQRSNNKVLFTLGKASAIATATIDGYAAVQKAWATPAPYNIALAALVGTATALNVTKIASQQAPAFAQGGFVGGNNFSGDNNLIRANSGEFIANREQQKNILKAVANGAPAGNSNMDMTGLATAIASQPIIVQIDGREIARASRNANLNGYKTS